MPLMPLIPGPNFIKSTSDSTKALLTNPRVTTEVRGTGKNEREGKREGRKEKGRREEKERGCEVVHGDDEVLLEGGIFK